MEKHSKEYTTQTEYQVRLSNFVAATKRVAEKNAKSRALNSTAFFTLNKFSDLSKEELLSLTGMKGYVPKQLEGVKVAARARAGPTKFDWRDKAGITAVKDQGQCGSCWAFSCTESVESVWKILGGKDLGALGPQQIVDCDGNDSGCNGGDLPTCYQYLQTTNGIELETNYPYKAVDGSCKAKSSLELGPINGFQYVIQQGSTDENAMADFIASSTPASIIVDASSWSDYGGGILTADQCSENLDHAVQAVGYDIGAGFWIVRNSWGPDWGENGFIRLQFGQNTCGMDSEVTVPTISSQ